ncbi:MAG: DUF6941 family protein [Planctomycetota bacterium]
MKREIPWPLARKYARSCSATRRSRARRAGETTLVGTFDRVRAPSYPATCGEFAVYFKMTDLNGSYDFEVVVLAPDLAAVVGRIRFGSKVAVKNPLQLLELAANAGGLRLPVPGRYAVRLMYNGLVADEFSLEAMEQP